MIRRPLATALIQAKVRNDGVTSRNFTAICPLSNDIALSLTKPLTDFRGKRAMEYSAQRLRAEIKQLDKEGRKGLKRILDAEPEHNEKALLLITTPLNEVTFDQFRVVMEQHNHDVAELVMLFRDKIDNAKDFFERVMSCQWRNPDTGRYEERSDVVIPYRSVIEYYRQELHYFKEAAKKKQRLCECGCGKPVFGQYKFASETCRKRLQRRRAIVPVIVPVEEVVTD
jgi:hypothetical protein